VNPFRDDLAAAHLKIAELETDLANFAPELRNPALPWSRARRLAGGFSVGLILVGLAGKLDARPASDRSVRGFTLPPLERLNDPALRRGFEGAGDFPIHDRP
jgi:hypothetical protein